MLYDPFGEEELTLNGLLGNKTSPVAEWCGLLAGLFLARAAGVERLMVAMDCKFIVDIINGLGHCHSEEHQGFLDRVTLLVKEFDEVIFQWVPRAYNQRADALCREALKEAEQSQLSN